MKLLYKLGVKYLTADELNDTIHHPGSIWSNE